MPGHLSCVDGICPQVKGILERAQEPSSRLSVCTGDSENPGVLTPVNAAMPRFYTVTSAPHVALARLVYAISTTSWSLESYIEQGWEFSAKKRISAEIDFGLLGFCFWH